MYRELGRTCRASRIGELLPSSAALCGLKLTVSFRIRILRSLSSTSELHYPTGISLLSLKNQLLLSYLHHLLAFFSLKLSSQSLTSTEGAEVVASLVKLRVMLEKISPLEGKLKYQIEKLVRKADQAADGADEDDVANGSSSHSCSAKASMTDRSR